MGSAKKKIAENYNKILGKYPEWIMIPKFNQQNEYFETYNSYVIQAKNRDKLRDHLIKKK